MPAHYLKAADTDALFSQLAAQAATLRARSSELENVNRHLGNENEALQRRLKETRERLDALIKAILNLANSRGSGLYN